MSEQRPLLERVKELIGASGEPVLARHPIGPAAIADWCDAIGDTNPCYLDSAAATDLGYNGLVAPPAMLDVWDRSGRVRTGVGGGPRAEVIAQLEVEGFVGVVAVNSDLSFERYLRPGELLSNVQILEDVSAEKQTALGIGHFVTTRHRYSTVAGEHVGDLRFRILKFRPGTGRVEATRDGSARAVNPDPAGRPRPAINRDNEVIWAGYRAHELRIPSCQDCGLLTFPPTPRCPECGSFERSYVVASGRGTLYSFATPHHPQVDGFRYPLTVGLVELEEGTRLVANLIGLEPAECQIGMALEVDWLDSHPAVVAGATDSRGPISLPQFRPATPVPCPSTPAATDVAAGLRLAPWVQPVTPTLIVSGALATRDFQEVHHDRDLALRRGSRDIFLNINTSVGLMQRYVTDALGPGLRIRAIQVRLGAPAYPYDALTFRGELTDVNPKSGHGTVTITARNGLGDHIAGTVSVTFPGRRLPA